MTQQKQRKFSISLADRELIVETGKLAELANGSCLIRYGDTVVLVTATASQKQRDGIDFLPLSVDFEEKLYAVGKIPGGYIKREGKPSEKSILASRLIDRPLRPLFPKDLRNDVSIVATILSVDQNNSPEIAAMIGASVALSISDIPFNGPIAGINVGLVNDKFVINPNIEQREKSRMLITVAGTSQKIVMIEAGANQVSEEVIIGALKFAHTEIIRLCDFINSIVSEIGVPEKFELDEIEVDTILFRDVSQLSTKLLESALDNPNKKQRDLEVSRIYEQVHSNFDEKYSESIQNTQLIDDILNKIQKNIVRNWILEKNKRVDGRKLDDIRELYAEVGLLPRAHGSGLFSRGQTQVLTVATLGALGDMQQLDGIEENENKRYMLHYNFPSFSVGETRPSRGPGRREIGHGALAERALLPVIPSIDEFPYAIRLVSEVLSSNGSTSQASVCGSSLALIDAGVPVTDIVAGISVGLVTDKEDKSRYATIMDIQGIEDFFGDMDFKIAGSLKGITAIQVDIKIDGLSFEIIEEAFYKAKIGRETILNGVIKEAISSSSGELSIYAPRVISFCVNPDKVRDVIGPGGKTIQKIIATTGVKIDIESNGKVYIISSNLSMLEKAKGIILGITEDIETDKIYTGTITKTTSFGAFVEFLPNREGMIHISKLDNCKVNKVEDIVKVGDKVNVRVLGTGKNGRIELALSHVL